MTKTKGRTTSDAVDKSFILFLTEIAIFPTPYKF